MAGLLLGWSAVLLLLCVSATAFEVEQPSILSATRIDSLRLRVASPIWVGNPRRGTLMVLRSKLLCQFATDTRKGTQAQTQAPIRLEGLIVLTEDGVCPLYEKALVADTLGAEGVLTLQPEPPHEPGGMLGYNERDTPLDMPVEIIGRSGYELLLSAVLDAGLEVVINMGRPLDVVRYF